MRKLILFCLFFIGLSAAIFGFLNFQGLAAQGTFETILLDFREDIPKELVQQDLKAIAKQYNVTPRLDNQFSAKDNVYIIRGDRTRLKALRKSEFAKHTEFIEPNYIYKIPKQEKVSYNGAFDPSKANASSPNDPFYSQQWNLHNIGMEGAWSQNKGSGVTVAVIDTGVTQVTDLAETKFVKGYDFVNDKEAADDDNGHGTHVAGIVAQATNNNYGVAGVAYEASIMPLKVLSDYGGGTIADIAEAIKFAADNGADVINMSLGGGGDSKLMKEAIDYAYQKGVVINAAAGKKLVVGSRVRQCKVASLVHLAPVMCTAADQPLAPNCRL